MIPLLKSEARRYTQFSLDCFLKNCLWMAPNQHLVWGGMNARVDNPRLVDYFPKERGEGRGRELEGRAGDEGKEGVGLKGRL